jgi:hypothetical protein
LLFNHSICDFGFALNYTALGSTARSLFFLDVIFQVTGQLFAGDFLGVGKTPVEPVFTAELPLNDELRSFHSLLAVM